MEFNLKGMAKFVVPKNVGNVVEKDVTKDLEELKNVVLVR